MESIGTYLKREREMRQIPLEDISRSTKIHLHSLQALERDDLKALPGQVFTKGFIQSYAKMIGLNVEQAVLHFEAHVKELSMAPVPPEKVRWLKLKRRPIKPWLLFLLFLSVVFAAAFLSSR